MPKWLPTTIKEYAQLNNVNLQKFEYGNLMDNALTLAIRMNNFNIFKYLLKRGVDPLTTNEDQITTYHMAVLSQRIDYISFLFLNDTDPEVEPNPNFKKLESWQKKAFLSIDKTT